MGDSTRTVKANKQVVVSCGACGTPPVLERSGIGAEAVLQRANIPVLVDLPGVGDGYEDHHTMTYLTGLTWLLMKPLTVL